MKKILASFAVVSALSLGSLSSGGDALSPAAATPMAAAPGRGAAEPQNHIETPAKGAIWSPSPKGAAEFDNYTLGPDSKVQPGLVTIGRLLL